MSLFTEISNPSNPNDLASTLGAVPSDLKLAIDTNPNRGSLAGERSPSGRGIAASELRSPWWRFLLVLKLLLLSGCEYITQAQEFARVRVKYIYTQSCALNSDPNCGVIWKSLLDTGGQLTAANLGEVAEAVGGGNTSIVEINPFSQVTPELLEQICGQLEVINKLVVVLDQSYQPVGVAEYPYAITSDLDFAELKKAGQSPDLLIVGGGSNAYMEADYFLEGQSGFVVNMDPDVADPDGGFIPAAALQENGGESVTLVNVNNRFDSTTVVAMKEAGIHVPRIVMVAPLPNLPITPLREALAAGITDEVVIVSSLREPIVIGQETSIMINGENLVGPIDKSLLRFYSNNPQTPIQITSQTPEGFIIIRELVGPLDTPYSPQFTEYWGDINKGVRAVAWKVTLRNPDSFVP